MYRVRKTEYYIQVKKKSQWLIALMFMLMQILFCKSSYRYWDYIEEFGNVDEIYSAEFPPILNSMLLLILSLYIVFFMLWGIFMIKYDNKENCIYQRSLTFDMKKIIWCQYEWIGLNIVYIIVMSIIGSSVVQVMINQTTGKSLNFKFTIAFLYKLLLKFTVIVIVFIFAFTIGRIVANLVKNIILDVAICAITSYFLIPRSWIYKRIVMRLFEDSKYQVVLAEDVPDSNVPVIVDMAVAVLICMIMYVLMLKLSDKRWMYEKRTKVVAEE